jgi:integrase
MRAEKGSVFEMARRFKLTPKFSRRYGRWILNVPPTISKTSKRQRLFYASFEEAQKAATRLKRRHAQFGVSLRSLTATRMGEASEVYLILDKHAKATGDDTSLLLIAKDYITRYKARNQSISLDDLFQEYLEAKEHLSRVHRKQIIYSRHRFKDSKLAGKMVSDIGASDLQKVLDELSAGTRNRYIRLLRSLWTFSIRKGYAKENPAARLDFKHLAKRPIKHFSNELIKTMLDLCLKEEIDLLPYLALGAFAGLRVASGEMTRLLWSDIKLDEKTIVVRAEISKVKARRFIPIADNLEVFLKAYIQRRGINPILDKRVIQIPPGTLRKARKRIFEKAWEELKKPKGKWIPAGLRHSYTSAMINSGETIDETILALGHKGNPTILWNHYYLAIPKEQALAYWQIMPAN